MLSANIAGLRINPAIMNAAGIFSFLPVLKRISEFDIGAVIAKSVCSEARNGHNNPVFAQCSDESYVNAVGLPGQGHILQREEMERHYGHFRAIKKPLIASIFDSSPEKLAEVAMHLEDVCDAFEMNLSCPNIMPGEKTGITIGRDAGLVREYAKAVSDAVKKPIIVKLPYTDDRKKIKEIALSAIDAGADAISAINTIPGGMKIDIRAKKPVLAAKFGGMSGKAIKPLGVGCVYAVHEALQKDYPDTPIIGIGGIWTAEDVMEYIEAGASAVGIGTAFIGKTIEEIGTYLSELSNSMRRIVNELGINELKDLVGAAHA